MLPLNLASRPFRNERLPALLLALGFTVAGAVTVKHVMAIRALMPGRTSGLAGQVRQLEDERARLRAETAGIRAPRPEPAAVTQWALLKDLVDRRTFAWSGLFAVLEEALPKGVRLISISPTVEKGQVTVELVAIARSNDDVLELIRALEERPEFADVLPVNRSGEDELNFRVAVKYTAPSPAVASASDPPAPASPADASPGPPVASAASPPPGVEAPPGPGAATAPPAAATGSAGGQGRPSPTGSAASGSAGATGSAAGTGSAGRKAQPTTGSAAGTGSAGGGRGRPGRERPGRQREGDH